MQLNQAIGVALIVVLSGFLLGAGVLSFSKFQETIPYKTYTTENETVAFVRDVNSSLTHAGFSSLTIVTIANRTHAIGSANYTSNTTHATIFTRLAPEVASGNYNVTYTWDYPDDTWRALGNMSSGLTNLSQQIPVVGTILGVALIIGVVLMMFAGIGGRGSR